MQKAKILVVDDESHIVELVTFNLEKDGFEVVSAYDGKSGIDVVNLQNPDLIILDIMLPGMDGLKVCRTLKQDPKYSSIPIIMLTAKAEEFDTVLGLEMGADDYIKKPFSPKELVARVKARLRALKVLEAEKAAGQKAFIIKDLIVIPDKHEVYLGEDRLELTPKEYELLYVMATQPGRVFTREALLERVWGYESLGDARTVDVHIRHLRQKLKDDPAYPEYVETVRGIGYRLMESGKA